MQKFKKLNMFIAAGFMSLALAVAPVAAATNTLVVTPGNLQEWQFNPDPNNSTPYNFTEDEASTGQGSLYVEPISSEAQKKFIGLLPIGESTSEFESLSYDFQIAGDGTPEDADQFYLNVYTNIANSTTFFDCRYDYVPTTGSLDGFTNVSFNATDTPTAVGDRADEYTCPVTLDAMPEGSTISAITLNVGDTGANDEGLAGYFDNVVLNINGDTTTYDFEANEPQPEYPTNKEECKNGGWEAGLADREFKNQGDCVSHFASDGKAKGNPVMNFFRSIFNR